jgi:4-aminobutyrate aminotransferase-like enzyme
LTRAPEWIRAQREAIVSDRQRALLDRFLPAIETVIPDRLDDMPWTTLHNDGNDANVLVDRSDASTVIGILDFGDMVEGPRAVDVAVCAAYASLGAASPLRAAAAVVSGYHEIAPLAVEEMEVLYALIVARLCLSVSVSASRRAMMADNPYLGASESAAWSALDGWSQVHPRFAEATFRDVCGVAATDHVQRVRRWLERNGDRAAPVLESGVPTQDTLVLDLSPGSDDPCAAVSPNDPRFATAVADRMRDAGVSVAFGRYLEPRRVYAAEQFGVAGGEIDDIRTVHIGIDVFAKAGTSVAAPFDGVVHSLADNAKPLDYGPTVILRHETDDGDVFFTLYGHLSRGSVSEILPGQSFLAGERVADLGAYQENGGWPPHLHFQVITDLLDARGDFLGVCPAWCVDVWSTLCPNPNLLLRVPTLEPADTPATAQRLMDRRRNTLAPSLSVSYRSPLIIVRGKGAYLFDRWGRRYLDGVNNVCHVGHCHPTVGAAIARQASVLNTNTRYLHESILEYAERLAGTLPAPLEVCFFTNSGSEANELAWRLARTHTQGTDMIVLDGAYHGNTSALVDLSPYKFDGPGGSGRSSHVQVVPTPDTYRGRYRGHANPGARYADHVAQAIEAIRAAGRRPAAFIAEPIMSCAGQVPLATGFLERAFAMVREAGAVCIADEVQTGFGRVGSHFWAFQTHGVAPDIVTMGKPIGNGHPLGAVVTTREIAQSFANGMEYFNTFGGNPVSCAAGLAVLDVIESERLQERAKQLGRSLTRGLRDLADRHEVIGDVRGSGLFLGIELVRDRGERTPAPREAAHLVNRMRDRGVLLSTDGPDHNVIKIKPPMVWSDGDADLLLSVMDAVMAEPAFSAV